jgi:GT2 family glycosyltransferase
MEARAPAVVAVVVTTAPGPGLEATLASLIAQDYPEVSLLVMSHGDPDAAARVAAVAPGAYVRLLEENRGFGAACNEASLMVEGAAFYLFCHDDVRLDPDALAAMVEGAFRTNAGVVTPKMVSYDDPLVLLHVGQTCDRFGVVQERVEPGEIDHGQQDLERDVFVAPGGATLVRADLFATLRGYDPLIPALNDDLDLCWRAQEAGARIVVVPSARVAHRETVLTGERAVSAVGTRRASRQDLLRRHQLLVVATGYSWRYTLSSLALLAGLDALELVLALVGRDADRAGAILGSWRWLAFHRRRVRDRRRLRRSFAVLSDADLRLLQVAGAPRLKRFVVTLVREGLDTARGILPEPEVEPPTFREPAESGEGVGFAAAFSESEEFDEISVGPEHGRRATRIMTGFRSQALVIALVAVAWGIGSRNLVAMHLPLVGRLGPLDSWWTSWRHLFASWSAQGLGSGAPGAPGFGVLAFAGTFVVGRMGVLPRLALILAGPLGAVGVARLLKGRVSNRARIVASLLYLAAPIGADLVAGGRVDLLAAVAAAPFLVRRLFDLLGVSGFPLTPFAEATPFGRPGWRATRQGQTTVAAMLIATVVALAPSALTLVAVVALAAALVRLVDRAREAHQWRSLGAVLWRVALLLAPLSVDAVLAGRRALELLGLARGPWSTPAFADLARAADGPFGAGWWGYLLPVGAVLAYLITRAERRVLADTFAALGAISLVVATLSARHWMGPVTPDLDVLLVLYATSLAVLIGLGISSVENDLRQAGFGWRQLAATGVVAATVAMAVPFVADLGSGRFGLPVTSTAESLSALAPHGIGDYRVLWLGDPAAMPLSGWSVAPGLEAATSFDGLPGGATLFTTPDAGTTDLLLHDVDLALEQRTVHLGSLLAQAGVSSIVVVNTSSPNVAEVQSARPHPVPAGLNRALTHQTDLALELSTPAVKVFANSLFAGVVTRQSGSTLVPFAMATSPAGTPDTVSGGDVVTAGLAPASAFSLDVGGQSAPRRVADGWAPRFEVPAGVAPDTRAHLVLSAVPLDGLLATATLAAWAFFALGFGRVRGVDVILARRRRRRGARHARPSHG